MVRFRFHINTAKHEEACHFVGGEQGNIGRQGCQEMPYFLAAILGPKDLSDSLHTALASPHVLVGEPFGRSVALLACTIDRWKIDPASSCRKKATHPD